MSSAIGPGAIIEGQVLPEPLRVVLVQPVGHSVKVGGQGLQTSQCHERLLTREQIRGLRIIPAEAPFDGDALLCRLVWECRPRYDWSVVLIRQGMPWILV